MTYLDFLRIRKDWYNFKKEIIKFEKQADILLPPIYRTFLMTYNTNYVNTRNLLSYYDSQYDKELQFYQGEFLGDNHINIQTIFPLEKMLPNMETVYSKDDFIWQNDVIAIGECNDQGYLLVGVGEENIDKIYIEYNHKEYRIKNIASNIFDFFLNYKIVAIEDDLPLYKNWGEDFWRIRKNKEEI